MIINTNNLVPITDANQNFSRLAKKVDESGAVVILKNNKPRYIISPINEDTLSENELVELVAKRILKKHEKAFNELAK